MRNQMIKYKDNIFSKMARFFSQLFDPKEENVPNTNKIKKKSQFYDNLKVEQAKQEARILNLQQQFEEGFIREEDLEDVDFCALQQLYQKQIKQEKQKLEEYKKRIMKYYRKK